MNTISMSVFARMKQFGTMRTIGMSGRQMAKMILAEAATYAISGIVIGCIIGIPMHWVVFYEPDHEHLGEPLGCSGGYCGPDCWIVLFSTLLAVRSPGKQLFKMSIVENIIKKV